MTQDAPDLDQNAADITDDNQPGANEPEASDNTSDSAQVQAIESEGSAEGGDELTPSGEHVEIKEEKWNAATSRQGQTESTPPKKKTRLTTEEKLRRKLKQEIGILDEYLKWKEQLLLKKVFDQLHMSYYNRWRTEANRSFRLAAGFKRRSKNPGTG